MNIVFVTHGDDKEYAFRVPDELVPYIYKDQSVLCETMHGLTEGTTTTGVIGGDGAIDIAIANGAYFPLKPIISFDDGTFHNSAIRQCIDRLERMFVTPLGE